MLKELAAITRFGRRLGLAFQVIDDILDANANLGNTWQERRQRCGGKKATYPAVIGLEKSRAEAKRLTREAHEGLSIFSNRNAETLHALRNILAGARNTTCSDDAFRVMPILLSRFAQRSEALRYSVSTAQIRIDLLGHVAIEIQPAIATTLRMRSLQRCRCTTTARRF